MVTVAVIMFGIVTVLVLVTVLTTLLATLYLKQCFSTAGLGPVPDPGINYNRAARGLRKLKYAARFH
jgi:hypothetical protein